MMHFADAAAWEEWLAAHHHDADAVWLRIARKGAPVTTVTITEALDVALCHGWIDGRRKALDEHFFLQRYSRRRKGSRWSRVNVEKAEKLIAAGRMRPPGMAEVDAARADGRWDAAYGPQRDAAVPPDLAAALAAEPEAAGRFETLGKTARYLLMLPVMTARTPAGRASAIRRVLDRLRQDAAVETRSTRSG
jgi:uncharacterized protein YdeI (YjbR/CyaY-like superfamily)